MKTKQERIAELRRNSEWDINSQSAMKVIDEQEAEIAKLKTEIQEQREYIDIDKSFQDTAMDFMNKADKLEAEIEKLKQNSDFDCKEYHRLRKLQDGELEKLKAKVEWQPIETAPKDGTAILVIGGESRGDIDGSKDLATSMVVSYERNKWVSIHTCYYGVEALNPTHWMPLPDKPINN